MTYIHVMCTSYVLYMHMMYNVVVHVMYIFLFILNIRRGGNTFATLQSNYAFGNVSADVRFPAIKKLIDVANVGVELEINIGIRNPQAGGWQGNFDTYLERVTGWESATGSIMRTYYYYGNVFVTDYAANSTIFDYYTRLYKFVKRIR